MSRSPTPPPAGRLELTWTNKDQTLLALDEGRSYVWVDPSDHRVAEVRLLDTVATYGETHPEVDRAQDNLLIQGDALNALTSLVELPEFQVEYAGKVKLAYIDPPFNTGQAFEQYDDALEHSVWLTMMRDRLSQIRDLLSPDGSVWVHLDQVETHYCKIVLDEVFGRGNFVGEVIWRAADSSNNDAKQFSVDHNTILVYSREPGWRSKPLARQDEHNAHYSNPDDDPNGPWFSGNVSSPNPRANLRFTIDQTFGWSGTPINPPANGWRWQASTIREKLETGEIVLREDEPGKSRLVRKTYLKDQGGLSPSSLWGDIEETGHNRQAKYELKKLFPGVPTAELFKTPKPERLMARIMELGSDPGDIVLDFFLGSATTSAVAMKTGRRWVGIEWSAKTISTFVIPRMQKVIRGTDDVGITDVAKWQGGGGFRHMTVHPSMFEGDELSINLAGWAVKNSLSEAIAAQIGVTYKPEPPFSGKKGRMRLCVIDGMVNSAVVELVLQALAPGETAAIYGTAVDGTARERAKELRSGSTVRKIPASILARYRLSHAPKKSARAAQLSLPTILGTTP